MKIRSREAAQECSPRRKPWVSGERTEQPRRGGRILSHTSGNILLHFIFSTLGRRPLIKPDFRADLFAYLSRLEAMKVFASRPYSYESLFRAFGEVMPDGKHLCMEARFFSGHALKEYARGVTTEEFVFARRVKLPRHGGPV